MNRGKEYFPLIKQYLEVELGYATGVSYARSTVDEVEVISSGVSDARKEAVKEAFLEGVVKIIIGTATIREGIDLQRRGTVIYNCYPEWNPTDIRQLEGRIWRQGNQFEFVRVVMPLVQDSMDVFVFQKLEEKTSRINDIWYRGDRGNVLDLESLDPQEVKLALITDVDRLVRMFFDQEKEESERLVRRQKEALRLIDDIVTDIGYYRSYRERLLEALGAFRTSLVASRWLTEPGPLADSGEERARQKGVELKDRLDEVLDGTEQTDKDLIALGRRVDTSYSDLRIYFSNRWYLEYFKEYASKVRKTERTVLKSKGYSLDSDFEEVKTAMKVELEDLEDKLADFAGGSSSPRWGALRKEIEEKKSALQVEGRSAAERAEEFARLNYLLEARVGSAVTAVTPPEDEEPEEVDLSVLELESLALELELELLDV